MTLSPLRWSFSVVFAMCGCSLLVDASDIDAGCPPGWKYCGGGCVRIGDPLYGCGPEICDPCVFQNAEPACSADGECVLSRCLWGFGCPVDNGCLTPILGDPKNCGACGRACDEGWLCQFGECVEPPTEAP